MYVTGRSEKDIRVTADEVTALGGKGVPVVCDHADENQIKDLFDKIQKVIKEKKDYMLYV